MQATQYFQFQAMRSMRVNRIIVLIVLVAVGYGLYWLSKNYKKLFGNQNNGNAANWQVSKNPVNNYTGVNNGVVPPFLNGGNTTNQNNPNSSENNTTQYFDTKNIWNYQTIDSLYKELSKDGGIDARDAAILLYWSLFASQSSPNDACTQFNNFYNVVKDKKDENHKLFLAAVKDSYEKTFGTSLYDDVIKKQASKTEGCGFGYLTFANEYLK